MTKHIIAIFCYVFLLVTIFYIPNIRWIFDRKIIEEKPFMVCSIDHIMCAIFKITIQGDPPYRNGYLSIKNKKTKQNAIINNFFMGIDDHPLLPTQLIWKNNQQLDVYLEGNESQNTSNFFFKDLGNLTVIIHQN